MRWRGRGRTIKEDEMVSTRRNCLEFKAAHNEACFVRELFLNVMVLLTISSFHLFTWHARKQDAEKKDVSQPMINGTDAFPFIPFDSFM